MERDEFLENVEFEIRTFHEGGSSEAEAAYKIPSLAIYFMYYQITQEVEGGA